MSKPEKYDFGGWATRFDVRCTDGRTIRSSAFKEMDGKRVPIVWSHQHDSPEFVLGHADLEWRPEGIYAYGSLNNTRLGLESKELVQHGDIDSLSIYANHLKQDEMRNVEHGNLIEVSLVLAGANKGAKIDYSLAHSEDVDEYETAAVIFNPMCGFELGHSDEQPTEETPVEEPKAEEPAPTTEENQNGNEGESTDMAENTQTTEEVAEQAGSEKTLEDVFNELTEEQKNMVYALVGQAVADAKKEKNNTEDDKMKHNAFDNTQDEEAKVLSHSEEAAIFDEARRSASGSLKEATLAHGITNIGYLFPDAKPTSDEPIFITREMAWVNAFMSKTRKVPFARIKSIFANITADEARAKGYITGNQKLEEVFALLKRATDPTTVYKLQKLDRDTILDITDYNTVAFVKKDMNVMIKEEIARAALIGDGRSSIAEDKIKEDNIRPIWTDEDLFTIHKDVEWEDADTETTKLKKFIRAALKARKNYKGAGNPTLFTTEDMLTDLLLLEDANGRVIYETKEKLATALRVDAIETVPVMENQTRAGTGDDLGYDFDLLGIIVNPNDYTFGANKGGELTMFDDFDINYNKYEYLLETRTCGALTIPYSAIALENKYEHVAG